MTIYAITATKGTETFMPELTCSAYMAQIRKEQLKKNGYLVNITQYEVKTQGKNFNTISQPSKFIE